MTLTIDNLHNLLDTNLPEFNWWPGEEIRSMVNLHGPYPVFFLEEGYIVFTDSNRERTRVIITEDKTIEQIAEESRQALAWWLLDQHTSASTRLKEVKKMINYIRRGNTDNG